MNDQYQALYQTFRWLVPTQFNIAEACCHRWASSSPDARRIAIYYEDEAGNREVWTYARLAEAANQLANGLIKMGVNRGDRVGVVLGQRPETVVAHMAIYSVGAVVLPVGAVRPRGPGDPAARLRDPCRHRRPRLQRQPAGRQRPLSRPATDHRHRLRRRAGAAVAQPAGPPAFRIQARSDPLVGPGHPALYLRHHRRAQGRPAAAQRADRQPARLRRLAGLVPQARRRLLVAGGLGLDRRHDGCAAAHPLFRPSHRRHPRPLLGRARLRADGALPGHQHLPVPDRPEDDDEGGA